MAKSELPLDGRAIYHLIFAFLSGIRQTSSLSPSLFNIIMNIFIVRLRALHCGCSSDCHFLGCILYAGDIVLLSAAVDGLQKVC
jgi:hypothetical protein